MRKKQRGFTLVELVIVILLIGLLSAFVAKYLSQALNAFLFASNVTTTTWEQRIAYERVIRDLRQIRSPTDLTTMTTSECAFVDMTGASFDYLSSGTTFSLNGQVLADGMQAVFSYFDKNLNATSTAANVAYITVELINTQNNANISFFSTAELRDFVT